MFGADETSQIILLWFPTKMSNSTLSILEVAELCDKGGLVLESRFMKDAKEQLVQRWFLNRVGVRGSLFIVSGDIVRAEEDPTYQPPFLGKKPERHADSPADSTSRGALTIIPDPKEQEAWIKFSRWIKAEILRVGAVRDKKNQVVTTMEKLESEFKDIVVEPEAGNDARKNVCFWQKFQVGSNISDLNTTFNYISCAKNAKGERVVVCGDAFTEDVWRAGSKCYTIINIGELKKAPTGWGMQLYTRKAFTDPATDDGREPVISFGGVRMKTAAELAAEEADLVAAAALKEVEATAVAETTTTFTSESVPTGTSEDLAGLSLNFSKFSNADEGSSAKRAKLDD